MSELFSKAIIEKICSVKNLTKFFYFYPFSYLSNAIKPTLKKAKKKVTIKNEIDIIDIEVWKQYNIDVSETGGCSEWDKNKKNDDDDDIYDFENEVCEIF